METLETLETWKLGNRIEPGCAAMFPCFHVSTGQPRDVGNQRGGYMSRKITKAREMARRWVRYQLRKEARRAEWRRTQWLKNANQR